jgi:hypothetical protein
MWLCQKFEDTKGVIGDGKMQKDRQCHDHLEKELNDNKLSIINKAVNKRSSNTNLT